MPCLNRDAIHHPGQQELVGQDFLLACNKLLRVPVRPDKLVLQEFCLWRSKPNECVTREISYQQISEKLSTLEQISYVNQLL